MFTPISHFFTEPQSIAQSPGQSFGAIDENRFAVTSRFTSTGAMAYALCKSIVFIQPQSGNDQLVNIILRPYQQPITGFNIRYIIYRGLRKQDFFLGDQVLPETSAQTDFIRKINQSFNNFYGQNQSNKPPFSAKFIGFDPINQLENTTIDNYFFKVSELSENDLEKNAFELPLVQAGDSLGFFNAGSCGIDIVLGNGDFASDNITDQFAFDLAYARKNYATIELDAGTDQAQRKRIKEQASQFLDVAAFYGFHVTGGQVNTTINTVKSKLTGTSIYDQLVSKFDSKNKLYLYIQSDRGRSYNFYGHYNLQSQNTNNIKIDGIDTNYGTLGWPIHIITSSQQHNQLNSQTKLQLVTDNNPQAMLYVRCGNLVNAVKNNFMDAKALQTLPAKDSQTEATYSADLLLENPATGNNSKQLIASFNILVYQGISFNYMVKDSSSPQLVVDKFYFRDFFDDTFDQLQAKSLFADQTQSEFEILSSQQIKLFRYEINSSKNGILAVQTLRVKDSISDDISGETQGRVTYLTEQVDLLHSVVEYADNLTIEGIGSSASATSTQSSTVYQLPGPYFYSIDNFTDGIENIKGLRLHATNDSLPLKIILGISDQENQRLLATIDQYLLVQPRIFMAEFNPLNNTVVSPQNISYRKYKLAITGEDAAGNLQLIFPEQDIIMYSLDNNYHFSQAYSQHMTEPKRTFIDQIQTTKNLL